MAASNRGKVLDLTNEERVARALSLCVVPEDRQARIYYCSEPGKNGGGDPEALTCASLWRDKADTAVDARGRLWLTADCVGLAMWAFGCDRRDASGVYWNQNSVYADALIGKAMGDAGRAWRFCDPHPGCLGLIRGPVPAERQSDGAVRPADPRIGHMVVVTEVLGGVATKVVHCSGSGKKRHGQAIGEDRAVVALGDGKKRPIYFVERVA